MGLLERASSLDRLSLACKQICKYLAAGGSRWVLCSHCISAVSGWGNPSVNVCLI